MLRPVTQQCLIAEKNSLPGYSCPEGIVLGRPRVAKESKISPSSDGDDVIDADFRSKILQHLCRRERVPNVLLHDVVYCRLRSEACEDGWVVSLFPRDAGDVEFARDDDLLPDVVIVLRLRNVGVGSSEEGIGVDVEEEGEGVITSVEEKHYVEAMKQVIRESKASTKKTKTKEGLRSRKRRHATMLTGSGDGVVVGDPSASASSPSPTSSTPSTPEKKKGEVLKDKTRKGPRGIENENEDKWISEVLCRLRQFNASRQQTLDAILADGPPLEEESSDDADSPQESSNTLVIELDSFLHVDEMVHDWKRFDGHDGIEPCFVSGRPSDAIRRLTEEIDLRLAELPDDDDDDDEDGDGDCRSIPTPAPAASSGFPEEEDVGPPRAHLRVHRLGGDKFVLTSRYVDPKPLGAGAFGKVLLCKDVENEGRLVAIKKISGISTGRKSTIKLHELKKMLKKAEKEKEKGGAAGDGDADAPSTASMEDPSSSFDFMSWSDHGNFLKKVLREVLILKHVTTRGNCPYLCPMFDLIPPPSYEEFDDVYIVMPYCGLNLRKALIVRPRDECQDCGPAGDADAPLLTADQVRKYMFQILSSLRVLHTAGILHRDVKGSNVCWDPERQCMMLMDFGLSRASDFAFADEEDNQEESIEGEAMSTSVVCTRAYRAPELLLGDRTASGAIDMWSAGCIFAEMMRDRGKRLFVAGSTATEQLRNIFEVLGTPQLDDLPRGKASLRQKALSKFGRLKGVKLDSLFSLTPPPHALDLLKRMVVYNPIRRISARAALQHAFFTSHRSLVSSAPQMDCPPFRFRVDRLRRNLGAERVNSQFLKDALYRVIVSWGKEHWGWEDDPRVSD